jgi:hypothetical protein
MRRLFLTILVLLQSILTFSQQPDITQTIKGTVVDHLSGYAISNATVKLEGVSPSIVAITDSLGNFKLNNVPIGRQILRASSVGYEMPWLQLLKLRHPKKWYWKSD